MNGSAARSTASAGWTQPRDIVGQMLSRWERGTYLRALAEGTPWEPVRIRLRGPSAQDLLERTSEATAWIDGVRSWAAGGRSGRGGPGCRIEDRVVRSRALGENDVPAFVVFDTIGDLARFVGRPDDPVVFARLFEITSTRRPELAAWTAAHPTTVLQVADDWVSMLDVVDWIDRTDTSGLYLRHLDLPGVDTKFVERHRKLLGRLLTAVLPPGRVESTATRFDARFGFRTVPGYVRFRVLSPLDGLPEVFSELTVRAEELARIVLPVRTVFVVENQATYLAFPDVADAIVVFGEGFKASTLESVPWLGERELVYWGDIDTHGFRILDQLRSRVPGVRSLLMDEATLTAHLDRVVSEDSPTSVPLENLTPAESDLYRDLVENRFGHAVRLEQERIRFGVVRDALEPWTDR